MLKVKIAQMSIAMLMIKSIYIYLVKSKSDLLASSKTNILLLKLFQTFLTLFLRREYELEYR